MMTERILDVSIHAYTNDERKDKKRKNVQSNADHVSLTQTKNTQKTKNYSFLK